jgi:hypothetical protein
MRTGELDTSTSGVGAHIDLIITVRSDRNSLHQELVTQAQQLLWSRLPVRNDDVRCSYVAGSATAAPI